MSFMRNGIFAFCLAVLPTMGSAATVIFDSFGTPESSRLGGALSVSPIFEQGLLFTASASGQLSTVDADFEIGPMGPVTLSLYEFDGTGVGPLLESQVAQRTAAGIGDLETLTFSGWTSSLVAGVDYALLASVTSGDFGWDFTEDTIANSLGRLALGPSTIRSPLTPVARVTLDVAPVPLPAGVPLVLTGILAFGVMSRRKKTA